MWLLLEHTEQCQIMHKQSSVYQIQCTLRKASIRWGLLISSSHCHFKFYYHVKEAFLKFKHMV